MRTDLPTKPPTGLTLRPYAGADDVPVIVDIINRELEHDGVPFRESVGDMGARYAHPSAMFEPARDVTIAEGGGAPSPRRSTVRTCGARASWPLFTRATARACSAAGRPIGWRAPRRSSGQ